MATITLKTTTLKLTVANMDTQTFDTVEVKLPGARTERNGGAIREALTEMGYPAGVMFSKVSAEVENEVFDVPEEVIRKYPAKA